MKILAISDVELPLVYSPMITDRFKGVDLVISCGDLPYYYLEFIISMLNVPLYYVNGNHQNQAEHGTQEVHYSPWGAIDLHRHNRRSEKGLLLSGAGGSVQYNFGPYQYSQEQMWWNLFWMVPGLMLNKMRFGRFLDVFVTHAPPRKIHDMEDRPHQGFKAFNWFDKVFQPKYHLHGHIHVYRQDTITETMLGQTKIINVYGYKELTIADTQSKKAENVSAAQLTSEEREHAGRR